VFRVFQVFRLRKASFLLEHLGISQGVPDESLISAEEHPEHRGTPKTGEQTFRNLPRELSEGLAALLVMPRPNMAEPEVWTTIVSDAVWLAESGWALQALKLGWEVRELFGVSADAGWQSLAVWLDGRRPLLIGERTAFVDKDGWRAIFNRRPAAEAILLWEVHQWLAER
jgi:hypothetical protein